MLTVNSVKLLDDLSHNKIFAPIVFLNYIREKMFKHLYSMQCSPTCWKCRSYKL